VGVRAQRKVVVLAGQANAKLKLTHGRAKSSKYYIHTLWWARAMLPGDERYNQYE
jgi:hypothetical protein